MGDNESGVEGISSKREKTKIIREQAQQDALNMERETHTQFQLTIHMIYTHIHIHTYISGGSLYKSLDALIPLLEME